MLIKNQSFKQQYASIYYIRLLKIRQALLDSAKKRWDALPGQTQFKILEKNLFLTELIEKPVYVQKILDIRPGELCYMLGTVYLEMPAKPNVMNNLEDEVRYIQYNACFVKPTKPIRNLSFVLLRQPNTKVITM